MPIAKVPEDIAQLVRTLNDQDKSHHEIARLVNLKPVQVLAILASHTLKSADLEKPGEREFPDLTPSPVQGDSTQAIVENEVLQVLEQEDQETRPTDRIYIGDDSEYADSIYWEPTKVHAVHNPHLMIMGESGSGKTYAVQCLVAELAQREIPSILFDYGQSFEMQHLEEPFKKFTGIREYPLSEEGLPLNPLEIFPNDVHGPKNVATRLSDVFDAAYRLGDIQRKVMIDAIRAAFERVGISETDQATWAQKPPTVSDLQTVLDELSSDREYSNYRNATGVAARLATFFMLSSFKSDRGWSWESLFTDTEHKVHILQFRGLEGKTQRVLVELLLWHLFFYLKSHGQGKLRLYCVLDEAHHISFRESGPVDSLLREARKFGLGIIFASQQPEDFSPAAFSNSASKLIFQTTDPTLRISKFLAAKCSNYASPEEISRIISVLRQGEAFFITQNRGHVVKLADFKKRATLWP